MIAALTAGDIAHLQSAYALAQAGDGAAADGVLAGLPAAARQHPDALTVAAFAATAQGEPTRAQSLFEAALRVAPGNPGIWNSYANLLAGLADNAGAIAAYQRALALDPSAAASWTNLALAAVETRQWDIAAPALGRALALAPGNGAALGALGLMEQARGRADAAANAYAAALTANPADGVARHNLATALRTLGRQNDALAVLAPATAADSAALRGHILADTGAFDPAVAQYREVIAATPGHIGAHGALAELLPQIGRATEALDGYRAALGPSSSAALWRAAIGAAKAAGDGEAMQRWALAAETTYGRSPDWTLARVGGLALLGDRQGAIAAARNAVAEWPQAAGAATYLAFLLLEDGDPAQAEGHALRASILAPQDQSPWSLLSLIWRLTGDAREAWLADYDRLVMVGDIDPPPGWQTLPAFLADLAETLTRLHIMRLAPAEQSLRGGTQTRGNLFDTADPVLKALESSLSARVDTSLATLPADTGHPFLSRNTRRAAMAGSWSVRLADQGFHINHIHHSGWLSSAFYVSLPLEIGGDDDAGKLLFGVPDSALGIDLRPRRIVMPSPGRLAIFPSYFWHGTAPFHSREPRLTVAFDMLPMPDMVAR